MAIASAALLAAEWLASGCGGEKPPSGPYLPVLAWASNLTVGDVAAEEDVSIVEVRQSIVDANPGLVGGGDLASVVGKAINRNVRRGEFVRLHDVTEAPATARTDTAAAPTTVAATGPYANLPEGDPAEVEAAGRLESYITTVRTARQEQLHDFSGHPTASSPMPLTTQPLAETGMTPLAEDAAEVVVPEGATRLYGFRHKVPGGVNETFAYLAPGDVGSVADFYRTTLPRNGYQWVKPADGKGDAERQYLTFAKAPETVYFVNLRPADKGKVKVVLMISRLEQK